MAGDSNDTQGWGEWLLRQGLTWLPLGGFVTFLAGVFGINSIYNFCTGLLPTSARETVDGWVDWVRVNCLGMESRVRSAVRDNVAPEQTTALNDFNARIDRYGAITNIDAALNLQGEHRVSGRIRELCKEMSNEFFGAQQRTDPNDVLTRIRTLHGQIAEEIETALKAQNPNYTHSDEQRFRGTAVDAATYITGLHTQVGSNPQQLTQAVGGMLRQFQEEVAKEGDYTTGQTPRGTVNEDLIRHARGHITGEIAYNPDEHAAAIHLLPDQTAQTEQGR